MQEPIEPSGSTDLTDPTQASTTAAAGQAASVRRVIAEAARSGPIRAGHLVPVTLARVALAEAAGLLPRRQPADLTNRSAEGPSMSTSTITTSSPPADRQEAAREQAALTRLVAAVAAMRAWRQLAPAPNRQPADPAASQGWGRNARSGARMP